MWPCTLHVEEWYKLTWKKSMNTHCTNHKSECTTCKSLLNLHKFTFLLNKRNEWALFSTKIFICAHLQDLRLMKAKIDPTKSYRWINQNELWSVWLTALIENTLILLYSNARNTESLGIKSFRCKSTADDYYEIHKIKWGLSGFACIIG